jgi:hypothetical protein
VGVLTKNILNKLALMGRSPGLAYVMEKPRRACPELVERGRLTLGSPAELGSLRRRVVLLEQMS